MRFIELKTAVLSIINENDPYKATKELHLKNWCRAFLKFLEESDEDCLPFFLDVLSDPGCWIETNTIHGIQLNRRKLARKIIEVQSWSCKTNPLDELDRFRIACWCCLEEDVVLLLENFKRQHEMTYSYVRDVKILENSLKAGNWYDRLTRYWIYIMGGYASNLYLEGMHIYEYGINIALDMKGECVDAFIGYHVEAVEFFWRKINLLSEKTLNVQRKAEIFMKTTLRAAESDCSNNPEILDFCISQICIDNYRELLMRDYFENRVFRTLIVLRYNRRLDLIQKMFDSLKPNDVLDDFYYNLLKMLMVFDAKEHSKYYVDKAVNFFMHLWMKKGFDRHRSAVLRNEMYCFVPEATLLVSLVKKNCMEPVWLMLDQTSPREKQFFMNSKLAGNILSILKERGDQDSLKKLTLCEYFYCVEDSNHSLVM